MQMPCDGKLKVRRDRTAAEGVAWVDGASKEGPLPAQILYQ